MSGLLSRLSAALEGRYRIDRELGEGGMAIVYLAEDLKHRRRVAIKVLKPEISVEVAADRFLREIRLAARLSHPHILPLFDSGGVDDLLYYVMPVVDGASLRGRLDEVGQLPVAEAVQIATEVAGALDHAHRNGVVHRDIKPGNILLHDGHAVVADFGIGRAFSGEADATVTRTGLQVGTPLYMSPEQAAGESNLDGRSDLYSLGCVLYEMLAGEPPFTGLSVQAVIAKRFFQTPADITALRDGVPRHLGRVVHRALSRAPIDRFETGAEMARALDEKPQWPTVRPASDAPEQSIAVLPFTNMSADPENEYFADGIAEEIINALAQLPDLRVAGRTSAFSFKGRDDDLKKIGDKLAVRTVLEGSVRRAGNRVRITAQLVDVTDGYHLWSQTYDRQMDDIFAVQDEIATAIADRLKVTLGGQVGGSLVKKSTESLQAYELYLKGRYVENKRTRSGFLKGIEHFREAVTLDPRFALAHTGLADSHSLLGWYRDVRPDEAFPKARQAALRALEIDDTLAEAHASLGFVGLCYDWDWDEVERSFRRALELDPRYATGHMWYAEFLIAVGRHREATEHAERARELDPLSLILNNFVGWVAYFQRRYDDAVGQLSRTLELDPDFATCNWFLGQAYLQQGMFGKAIDAFESGIARSDHLGMRAYRGYALALAGRHEDAERVLATLKDEAASIYVPADYLSLISMGLGRIDEALSLLNRALDERVWALAFLNADPIYDGIRSEPRFIAIAEQVGLQRP